MHALSILAAAAAAEPPSEARRHPPVRLLQPRADPTAPWVTVDDEGRPARTITPSITTVSGTPTVVDGAPHDLTATVFTTTFFGEYFTSTGEPPNPVATSKNKEGAFSRCFNADGDFAPFCSPLHNSTLVTGSTYYITWDPDFYNKTDSRRNTTYEITVRLDYLNKTNNEWVKLETFDHDRVPAAWGFWPFPVTSKYLMGEKTNNVTITLLSAPTGSNNKNNSIGLPIAIQPPGLPANRETPVPKGRTLTIAIPVCLATFALLLIGTCLWNRKTRRIELGNIMSRSRHGYSGRKSRRRMFRSKPDNAIPLSDSVLSSGEYHDDMPGLPRRDSDALGSLAGSPTNVTFERQGAAGDNRNAFRDEVARQDMERRERY